MKGGLDLVSPALSRDPGSCFSAQNYEPSSTGGYRRVNGFERSDGHTAPTGAAYWLISLTISGAIAVGNTVTGATSAATGRVLQVNGTTQLVLARVSGTFVSGENLTVAAVVQGATTSTATQNSAADQSDHVDYRALAATDRRADISAVPGSGMVRGVFVLADVVYALRDNVGGTAGDLYKQTASGWSQVAFGREIQFTGGAGEITEGQTVTGATSGATAVARRILLRTGAWTGTGVGTIVFASVTGTFQNGENLQVAAVTKAVANGVDTAITRAAAGRLETVLANFSGAIATKRIYGTDGVNLGFEFDGTYYVPIRTGMTVDTPKHVESHATALWFTFGASLQKSSPNAPFTWTVVTGAAEYAMGDTITGIKSIKGSQFATALLISVESTFSVLYGSTTSDFDLVPSGSDLGFDAWTIQSVGNDVFGLTAGGIQSLQATQVYGSFAYADLSTLVRPLLATKAGLQTASVALKSKSQYRLFFSDNTCLVVGLAGGSGALTVSPSGGLTMGQNSGKISGIMLLDYGLPVRCVCNAKLSSGIEVTYFGSDDGYVYKDNVGYSFDGDTIESWFRTSFNNLQSPLLRKEYKRAFIEVESEGYAAVRAACDIGYGSPDVEVDGLQEEQELLGGGGYWDSFDWDTFTWDAPVVTQSYLPIEGTENNISFLFYSDRAKDDPHTVQGVNLVFIPRRLTRGGG